MDWRGLLKRSTVHSTYGTDCTYEELSFGYVKVLLFVPNPDRAVSLTRIGRQWRFSLLLFLPSPSFVFLFLKKNFFPYFRSLVHLLLFLKFPLQHGITSHRSNKFTYHTLYFDTHKQYYLDTMALRLSAAPPSTTTSTQQFVSRLVQDLSIPLGQKTDCVRFLMLVCWNRGCFVVSRCFFLKKILQHTKMNNGRLYGMNSTNKQTNKH